MKKKLFGGKETAAEERKEAKSGRRFAEGGIVPASKLSDSDRFKRQVAGAKADMSAIDKSPYDVPRSAPAKGGIVPASKLSDSDRFKRQVAGAKADMSAIDKSPYDVPRSAPANKLEAKVDAVNAETALTQKATLPQAKPVKSETRKSTAPISRRKPSESNASRAARQAAYDDWKKTNRDPMTKLYDSVKSGNYAKGGVVKGDGCASKGKTKGRMI